MKVCVLGGGSWGTALAHVLACAGQEVFFLLRDSLLADQINLEHVNPRYLPGSAIHPAIQAVSDPAVLRQAELVVIALPCQSQRQILSDLARLIEPGTLLVQAGKGIELASLKPMSMVVAEALGHPEDFAHTYAVLSGPSFAREVVEQKPTAVVLGCRDEKQGARLRQVFATPWFRAYSSPDVCGVELGGAVKNVMAIAAGASDGLNFGANARAALLTRGLAEITRLGLAMGAQAATFMGLSGLGDLVLTATGDLSRNRQVGLGLGRGNSLEQIVGGMRQVAEGVMTTRAVRALAEQLHVEMPITQKMAELMDGKIDPESAVKALMGRSLKAESI